MALTLPVFLGFFNELWFLLNARVFLLGVLETDSPFLAELILELNWDLLKGEIDPEEIAGAFEFLTKAVQLENNELL